VRVPLLPAGPQRIRRWRGRPETRRSLCTDAVALRCRRRRLERTPHSTPHLCDRRSGSNRNGCRCGGQNGGDCSSAASRSGCRCAHRSDSGHARDRRSGEQRTRTCAAAAVPTGSTGSTGRTGGPKRRRYARPFAERFQSGLPARQMPRDNRNAENLRGSRTDFGFAREQPRDERLQFR
jgi:hypothetical protein